VRKERVRSALKRSEVHDSGSGPHLVGKSSKTLHEGGAGGERGGFGPLGRVAGKRSISSRSLVTRWMKKLGLSHSGRRRSALVNRIKEKLKKSSTDKDNISGAERFGKKTPSIPKESCLVKEEGATTYPVHMRKRKEQH